MRIDPYQMDFFLHPMIDPVCGKFTLLHTLHTTSKRMSRGLYFCSTLIDTYILYSKFL
jgi:hypothetical protein